MRTVIAGEGARRGTSHLERVDQFRPHQHPREALLRRVREDGAVQPDRRSEPARASATSASTPRRARRSTRRHRQGLRDPQGRVRARHRRRARQRCSPEPPTRSTSTSSWSSTRSTRSSSTAPTTSLPRNGPPSPTCCSSRRWSRPNKVAIARFVMRSKQYVAALRPRDGRLTLSMMVYEDEVNSATEIPEFDALDDIAVTDRELAMAEQLIDSLSAPFEPDRFHDSYREELLDLIHAKSDGVEIVSAPLEAPSDDTVIDLMAALEASVSAAKEARGRHPTALAEAETIPERSATARKATAKATSRKATAKKPRRARPRRPRPGRRRRRPRRPPGGATGQEGHPGEEGRCHQAHRQEGRRAGPQVGLISTAGSRAARVGDEGHIGRGRRPHAHADEPRQGALSRRRVHQVRGDRLLRPDRARRCSTTPPVAA